MTMKISDRHSSVLESEDGKHAVLCSRMGLREGDEGATRCLHAFFPGGQENDSTRNSLSDLDDQVWKELSDDWQRYLLEKKKAPLCEPKLCPESFQNRPDELPVETSASKRFCITGGRIVWRKERE